MTESRVLVDFFRASIPAPEDPHLAESQEAVREAVMRFENIDRVLRTFGV